MAKIKYSALVSDMRGKLNGSVASKNRFGSYYRNKVTPVNPQSTFQQNARQRFGALSSQFKDLSPAQIAAWNAAAENFPLNNIFGDQVFLTGQMLFNQLNGNCLKVGSTVKTAAPSPVSFSEFVADSATAVSATGSITVEMVADTVLGANEVIAVYATRPVPVTKSFLKNEYRYIGYLTELDLLEADISTLYADRFGTFESGQKIGIRMALVNAISGQQGVPLEVVPVST